MLLALCTGLDGRLVCALDPSKGELTSFAVVPSHSKTSVYTYPHLLQPVVQSHAIPYKGIWVETSCLRGNSLVVMGCSMTYIYRLYITIRLYSCVECVHICLVWGAHTGALLLWYSMNASIHACLSYLHCVFGLHSCHPVSVWHMTCAAYCSWSTWCWCHTYVCLHMYVCAQSLIPGGARLWPADDCVRGECEWSSTPLHCDCLWRSALPWIGHVPLWGRFWDHPLHWWLQVLTYSVGTACSPISPCHKHGAYVVFTHCTYMHTLDRPCYCAGHLHWLGRCDDIVRKITSEQRNYYIGSKHKWFWPPWPSSSADAELKHPLMIYCLSVLCSVFPDYCVLVTFQSGNKNCIITLPLATMYFQTK